MGSSYSLKIVLQILDLRVLNQLLALQHAAQQQADDDEDDCDFNQREAGLALAGATQSHGFHESTFFSIQATPLVTFRPPLCLLVLPGCHVKKIDAVRTTSHTRQMRCLRVWFLRSARHPHRAGYAGPDTAPGQSRPLSAWAQMAAVATVQPNAA